MDTQTPNNEMAGAQTASGDTPVAGKTATPANKPAMAKKNPAPAKSAMPKGAAPKSKSATDKKAALPAFDNAGKEDNTTSQSSAPKAKAPKAKGNAANAAKAAKIQAPAADKNKLVSGSTSPVAFYNPKAKSGQDSTPSNDLKKVMVDTLKDIYYAEKRILKALPKMAKNAAHDSLREAFMAHKEETEGQIQQVEKAFEMLGLKAQTKKCVAMDGLLEEADEHMKEYVKGAGRDAAMIVGAQKVEHYEMAAYGSLRNFAQNLGQKEVAQLFQAILNQEGATDKKLTQIAKTINADALKEHKDGKVK